MSKIVLCETQEAPYPYKIEKIHRSFSSYEELCYLLEHYMIFFLMEGIDFRMKSYMKEELGIPLASCLAAGTALCLLLEAGGWF